MHSLNQVSIVRLPTHKVILAPLFTALLLPCLLSGQATPLSSLPRIDSLKTKEDRCRVLSIWMTQARESASRPRSAEESRSLIGLDPAIVAFQDSTMSGLFGRHYDQFSTSERTSLHKRFLAPCMDPQLSSAGSSSRIPIGTRWRGYGRQPATPALSSLSDFGQILNQAFLSQFGPFEPKNIVEYLNRARRLAANAPDSPNSKPTTLKQDPERATSQYLDQIRKILEPLLIQACSVSQAQVDQAVAASKQAAWDLGYPGAPYGSDFLGPIISVACTNSKTGPIPLFESAVRAISDARKLDPCTLDLARIDKRILDDPIYLFFGSRAAYNNGAMQRILMNYVEGDPQRGRCLLDLIRREITGKPTSAIP